MRVIAGKAKGRNLKSVPGDSTRPILDRVKTSLFDILRPELEGTFFLDLFAGSGSVGIEALSQGAVRAVFLDLEPQAVETIKENLKITGLSNQAEVKNIDAFRFLRNTSQAYDIIYVAPPQYQTLWSLALQTIAERPDILTQNGLIIAQIDPKEYEPLDLREFQEVDQRTHGNTMLVFYRRG